MGLQPLEFSDCLTDSPFFREKLHAHEKELERTSKAIKGLISECKDLISAAKNLSKAQKNFSQNLKNFKFECIGSEQTEDEKVIEQSLKEFGNLIGNIEEEREKILTPAFKTVIEQLEQFRKDKIGNAKEEKKKFEKSTAKFCQALEKHLGVKNKTSGDVLKEADAQVDMEKRCFYESSMQYVLVLQEVQERKKFEFVENLLLFMLSWLTFYHQGYEVSKEFTPYIDDLKSKLQKCRENFDVTSKEAEQLKTKMLEVRGTKPLEHKTSSSKNCTREGYLYMMEKKPLGTTWSKLYCEYTKETKILRMIPYSQQAGKGISTDTSQLLSCRRRATDTIDRRFCFDATVQLSPEKQSVLTLQAVSEEDMQLWLQAMDGKEPIYSQPIQRPEYDSLLDDIGFSFINRCIQTIEERGLDEQGLYRIVGVASKVSKLTNLGLDKRKAEKIDFQDPDLWETKTVTSALKNYFRTLPEPLMTFELHSRFVTAAKRESKTLRLCDIHELVHQLPEQNFEMLKLLVAHLKRVSQVANKNLMTVPNLGVCFGPTLLRPPEETMAAIMDIKWCNIVVELLIYNFEKFFNTPPEGADVSNSRVLSSSVTEHPVIASKSATQFMGGQLPAPAIPGHVRHHSSGAVPSNQPLSNSNQHNQHPGVGPDGTERERTGSFGNSAMSNSYTGGVPPGHFTYNNVPPGQEPTAQTYAQYRQKIKPQTGIHSQYSPDHNSSRSSSSESLTSRSSSAAGAHHSPVLNSHPSNGAANGDTGAPAHRPPPRHSTVQQDSCLGSLSVIDLDKSPFPARAINRFSQVPTSGLNRPDTGSSSSYVGKNDASGSPKPSGKRVRALYSCDAENDSELSFEPNDVILNVRNSKEPGWLEGHLNGKFGLIPANYVVYID